jgi:WD40 repeat protein
MMFSASRDRFIKLWNINYDTSQKATKGGRGGQVDLIANLDGHTDWVN